VRWQVVVLALAAAPAAPLLGDVVFLKGGGKVTGEIVKETEEKVTVDIGMGTMAVQKSSVVRIERSASPLQEYRAQAATLAPEDVEGWRKLGREAARQGLSKQAREAFAKVKAIAPDDPEANRALGLVLLDGHWVTEKESFTARGFVQFEGEWMMPAERQAIVEERRASEEADRQALDAQIEADQAERAEQEEQEAAERDIWTGPLDQLPDYGDYAYGYPVYYGYGPTVWPTQPGNRPRAENLPARRRQ
jgi:hypothetical protein